VRVCATPALASRAGDPYTFLLYSAVEEAGAVVDELSWPKLLRHRYDIVHFHWPEWYLYARPRPRLVVRSAIMLAAVAWARLRGARLVWTVHNLEPHEPTPERISRWYWWAFTGMVDGFVSLTESGLHAAPRRHPRLSGKPSAVIPAGHLRGQYPDHGSQTAARTHLGIPAHAAVAAVFGHVRPYKNVPGAVRAFRALPEPDAVLVIAGRPLNCDVRAEVEAAAEGDARVRLHLGFVAREDVQHFLRAADLVVLPYTEVSNSGVALLALSFDRPILVPASGAFPELAELAGSAWVRLYDGELTPAVLARELAAAHGRHHDQDGPDLAALAWPAIGAATLAAYRRVVGASRLDEDTSPTPQP
jgi:glycosyltransferase involved in cell wall biosynthesis